MGRQRNERDKDLPSGLYRREDSEFVWMWFRGEDGKRKGRSSGEKDVGKALAVRKAVLRKVDALKKANAPVLRTVEWYATQKFLPEVTARNPANAAFHKDNLRHALPRLGSLLLEDVRRHHLIDLVRALQSTKEADGRRVFAPRTILHVYGSLRVMFRDALIRELIDATPCTLSARHGELPKKRDKDPTWRKTALYTKEEVGLLCWDERIAHLHRVAYALLFFTGLRGGELVVRRWRDYDAKARPLGRLMVATASERFGRGEKEVKTGIAREHPIHPALAAILAEWRLSGWERTYGRAPTPDDFILCRVPTARRPALERMSSKRPYRWLNGSALKGKPRLPGDLDRLGLRRRREHDTRRTLISLAQADGARKEVLEYITHGPSEADAFDEYTTWPWETQCEEILKLRIAKPTSIVTASYGPSKP